MKWISVKNRLPEVDDLVLVYVQETEDNFYGMFVTVFTKYGGFNEQPPNCGCSGIGEVTHWQPLPEPPTED